jgi:hypothetical protein
LRLRPAGGRGQSLAQLCKGYFPGVAGDPFPKLTPVGLFWTFSHVHRFHKASLVHTIVSKVETNQCSCEWFAFYIAQETFRKSLLDCGCGSSGERLPSKLEAPSSNTSIAKKRKKKKQSTIKHFKLESRNCIHLWDTM